MNEENKIQELITNSVAELLTCINKELGQMSFSEIVEMTTQAVKKLGATLIEEIVSSLDVKYYELRDKHTIQMRNNKRRTMLTQLGEVTLQRRLYYDKIQKRYFFAVDELLNIERRSRVEAGLKQELITNATLMSYGKASELCGGKVSRQTVHNIVKQVPEEKMKIKEQGLRSVDNIYIEADEDHIHLNTGKSAEVKLVYVHEGTREVCKGRRELINPRYFASISTKEEDIWNEVSRYVYEQYKTSKAQIHISGDGAQWIKNGVYYFIGAKYHLDKFHVYKSVTDVIGNNKALRRAVLDAIQIKDFETVRDLYSLRYQEAKKIGERKYIANGFFYLDNNFDEIDLSKNNCCAAEGHVSHVLSARLSSRPMGWSRTGAEKIAKLRAYYFSGGDFSNLITRNDLISHKNSIKIDDNVHIAKKINKAKDIGLMPGRVVGLDGVTDGISVILRSLVHCS